MDFGRWITGLGPLLGNEGSQNKQHDTSLANDQQAAWGRDRAAVGTEWAGLLEQYDNEQFSAPAIVEYDPFEAMSHQQIYDALQGIAAGEINTKADGWRNLKTAAEDSINEFTGGVEATVTDQWTGQSGSAIIDGTHAFSASFRQLTAAFQMVAHGLDLTEGHLAQAKTSVGEPDNVTFGDTFISALPKQDVLKGPEYRAGEAEETARWVMTNFYRPGVGDVDSRTPILPQPRNPVADGPPPPTQPGGPGAPSPGPPQQSAGPGGPTPPGNTPEGEQPPGEQPQQQQEPPGEPQSTTPAGAPQSTTPAGAPQTPTGEPSRPNAPTTPTSPGSPGAPTGPGSPGGPGAPSPPRAPGRSTPGAPGDQGKPQQSSAPAAQNGARSGRPATPGMMPPGQNGKRDEDNEHETPDYLIYDHGTELLGTQPPALPPGGVIGE